MINVIGNGVATLVISRWNGSLNMEQLQDELNHGVNRTSRSENAVMKKALNKSVPDKNEIA